MLRWRREVACGDRFRRFEHLALDFELVDGALSLIVIEDACEKLRRAYCVPLPTRLAVCGLFVALSVTFNVSASGIGTICPTRAACGYRSSAGSIINTSGFRFWIGTGNFCGGQVTEG
jgi:hypothetical protein